MWRNAGSKSDQNHQRWGVDLKRLGCGQARWQEGNTWCQQWATSARQGLPHRSQLVGHHPVQWLMLHHDVALLWCWVWGTRPRPPRWASCRGHLAQLKHMLLICSRRWEWERGMHFCACKVTTQVCIRRPPCQDAENAMVHHCDDQWWCTNPHCGNPHHLLQKVTGAWRLSTA